MPLLRRRPADEREPPRPQREPGRLLLGWRRFRRATDRYRLLTDVVGGILLVLLIVGGLSAATGGVWPPLVTVESHSMMHGNSESPYGRVGSIDVGDVVFIRAVDGPEDVATWAQGGALRYGRPGDVIAYAGNGDRANTTIIHRAIAWVDVERQPTGALEYKLHWTDGQVLAFGPAGIYFPPLGFDENFGYTATDGYRPAYSGFLTKGDNAFSNPAVDQAMGISRIVDPSWIDGEAYGEVPWMGLAKLALQSGQTNPYVAGFERVGNAFAPLELWTMFFIVIALIILIPFSLDTWRAWRAHRERIRLERKAEEEAEARRREREAKKPAKRAPVAFTPVAPGTPRGSAPPRQG